MNQYQWIAAIAMNLNLSTVEVEDRLLKAYHLMPKHQLSMYVRMLESGIFYESVWTRDDHNLVAAQFGGWRKAAISAIYRILATGRGMGPP